MTDALSRVRPAKRTTRVKLSNLEKIYWPADGFTKGDMLAFYDQVSELWGFPSGTPMAMQIVQCFSQRPEYVEPVGRGYYYIGWCAETPRDLLELVAVLVSRENECFY